MKNRALVLAALAASTLSSTVLAEGRLGSPAAPDTADRVVRLDASTHYVNVTQGETVTFRFDGESATWRFDTAGTPTFDLGKIVPEGRGITVYMEPDPLYKRA